MPERKRVPIKLVKKLDKKGVRTGFIVKQGDKVLGEANFFHQHIIPVGKEKNEYFVIYDPIGKLIPIRKKINSENIGRDFVKVVSNLAHERLEKAARKKGSRSNIISGGGREPFISESRRFRITPKRPRIGR